MINNIHKQHGHSPNERFFTQSVGRGLAPAEKNTNPTVTHFTNNQGRFTPRLSFNAFSLKQKAKEKALQKERPQGVFRSYAESDKGYAPLTAPPFEKGGRKLSLMGECVSAKAGEIFPEWVCAFPLRICTKTFIFFLFALFKYDFL